MFLSAGKRAAKAIGSAMFDELDNWKRKWLKPGDVPYCDLDNRIIASPPFGFLDKRQDAVVRCCDIHETAHAILSEPISKLQKYIDSKGESKSFRLLKDVLNSIEDRRIEAWASDKWVGAGISLREGNRIMASEWNTKMSDPTKAEGVGEIRQALIYLSFKDENIPVNWTPSPKAQEFIELIGEKFHSWRNGSDIKTKAGFWTVTEISREIVKLIEQKIEEDKKQEQEQEQKQEQEQEREQNNNSGDNQNNESSNDNGSGESDDNESSDDGDDGDGDGKSNEKSDEKSGESDGGDDGDGDGKSNEKSNEKSGESDDGNDGDGESDESDNNDSESNESDGDSSNKQKSEYKDDKNCKPSTKEITDDEVADIVEEMLRGEDLSETIERMTAEVSQESVEDDVDNYTADTTRDEWRVPKGNTNSYEIAKKEVSCSVAKLTKYIENALQSVARSKKLSDRDRGKLDKRKLHLLAKSLSKKVFYKVRDGKKLNTCVSIVIDESGSMCGEQEKSVRCLSIALAECLTKLNIPFEIAGFSTTGCIPSDVPYWITRSNPMIIKLYKSFDERYQAVRTRLGNISSYNNHVDGEALEMMAYRMRNRKEQRKVIISLSDGEPYAGQGYSITFQNNLKRVVKKLCSTGFEVYGFGINTESPKKYYGEKNFVYLDSIRGMGEPFFKKLFEIISKGM